MTEHISKYKKIRILSARTLQLAQGAPPLVKFPKNSKPEEIARLEWESGVIPIDARK